MLPSFVAGHPSAARKSGRPTSPMNNVSPVRTHMLHITPCEIVNDDGDRLRSVTRCFQHLQTYALEFENVAIATRSKCVRCFGRRAEIDRCAHAIAQFQMPGNEIGVEMSQEYVLDLERVFGSKLNVLVRIPLSTTAAVPVDGSPMRQEACARHGR